MNRNLTLLKLHNSIYQIPPFVENRCPLLSNIGKKRMLAFKAFVASEKGPSKNWEKLARHFLDTYVGQYESREDYAKVYLSESGEWGKIPPLFRDCFDFFLYARALFSSVVYDLKAQRGIYVFFNCKPESD